MISTSSSVSKPIRSSMQSGPKSKRLRTEDLSPSTYSRALFQKLGLVNPGPKSFEKPREEDVAAYDLEIVKVVRSRNIERLRELYSEGKNLNACNQFGESLLHMACRRGDIHTVSFLIREAKVRVDVRDDFGRNPFHDACWTSSPNFDVMDILVDAADPIMLITADVRGNTAFDYARREHFGKWLKYLHDRRYVFQSKIKQSQTPA